jgi:hypothetical protein
MISEGLADLGLDYRESVTAPRELISAFQKAQNIGRGGLRRKDRAPGRSAEAVGKAWKSQRIQQVLAISLQLLLPDSLGNS